MYQPTLNFRYRDAWRTPAKGWPGDLIRFVLQQEWVDEDPRDETLGIQREWRDVPVAE
jgi:hypothetical protein